jgi:hypothetical protein
MAGPLILTHTTEKQLRLRYDATNYADFTTGSTGDLTIAPTGGDTSITGTLAVSSTVTGGTYNGQTISSAASLTGTLAVTGATTLNSRLLGGHSTTTGAGSKDWILAKGAALQSQDGDLATTIKHLVGVGWTGSLHTVNIAASGQAVGVGAPSTFSGMVGGDMRLAGMAWIKDGSTAPTATAGYAALYVDAADGDLKVKFGDGITKTLATDT